MEGRALLLSPARSLASGSGEGVHMCASDWAEVAKVQQRVQELELQVELQQARNAQSKVRHLATIAPLLRSLLRDVTERLLRASIGSWRYATASMARTKAVERRYQLERDAVDSKVSEARAVAVHACSGLVTRWNLSQTLLVLKALVLAWHRRARIINHARSLALRRATAGVFHFGPVGSTLSHADVALVVLGAWRSLAVDHVASLRAEGARSQRQDFRLQICEARNQLGSIRCEAEVAEVSADQLRLCAGRALSVLGLALSAPNSSNDIDKSAEQSALVEHAVDCTDDATLMERAIEMQRLREKSVAQLVAVRDKHALALDDTGPVLFDGLGTDPPSHGETRTLQGVVEKFRELRIECATLSGKIANAGAEHLRPTVSLPLSARSQAQSIKTTTEVEAEINDAASLAEKLQQERQKTAELERRVAAAQLWVTTLRERHRRLLQESAEPVALPDLQKALSELARVSEELLSAN